MFHYLSVKSRFNIPANNLQLYIVLLRTEGIVTVRYPKRFDAKLLKRYLKEKRGEGEGASYNPWIHIYDLPSEGLSSIVPGWKTEGRDHR
jgi:hypothetical protein